MLNKKERMIESSMLFDEIEEVRREMVKAGMEKGLRHPDVLSESQYLDSLIVTYLKAALETACHGFFPTQD